MRKLWKHLGRTLGTFFGNVAHGSVVDIAILIAGVALVGTLGFVGVKTAAARAAAPVQETTQSSTSATQTTTLTTAADTTTTLSDTTTAATTTSGKKTTTKKATTTQKTTAKKTTTTAKSTAKTTTTTAKATAATTTKDTTKATTTTSTTTTKGTTVTTQHTVHTWGAWVQTKAATCGEAGEMTRTCSVCGATETQEIPATGEHTLVFVGTMEIDGEMRDVYRCSVCNTQFDFQVGYKP